MSNISLEPNRQFAVAVCEAIGLNPDKVDRLSLHFTSDGMIRADVGMMLVDDGTLYTASQQYTLEAKKV